MTLAASISGAPRPATAASAISHPAPLSEPLNSGVPRSAAPPIGKNGGAHRDGGSIPPIPCPLSPTPGGAPGRTGAHRGAPGADLALDVWTAADITAFLEHQSRLLLWGWSAPDAERLAERLVHRGGDDRRACVECLHYRPGRCGAFRAAGLNTAEVGRDLATLLQRCPGFRAGVTDRPSANTPRPAPSLAAAGRHPPLSPPPGALPHA